MGIQDSIQLKHNTDGFTRGALLEIKLELGASYGLNKALT